MRMLGLMAAFCALVVAGCVSARAAQATCGEGEKRLTRDSHWRHHLPRHPLLGHVFTKNGLIVPGDTECAGSPVRVLIEKVWDAVGDGAIVLLGEVHDNVEQHLIRADILRSSITATSPTSRPAAVFEHIHAGQQFQLDDFYDRRAHEPLSAHRLLHMLNWHDAGWPSASMFEPLFEAALVAGLPIIAGDAPRDQVKAVMRRGPSMLSGRERASLDLSEAMPRSLIEALSRKIESFQCDELPAQTLAAMNAAQRYRDGYMARVVLEAARQHGAAFLLAGNDHVRLDRGVPWHLHLLAPAKRVVTVLLREVEPDLYDPLEYLPRDPDGRLAADYVLFTPAQARANPCR
jgi:uncharacterized iron-regulated protein